MNIKDQYPINTFSGTTQDELVEFIEAYAKRERLEELKNLPPYMFDAYPSLTDRLKTLKEGE